MKFWEEFYIYTYSKGAVNFASKGNAHMKTDAQIKFLYPVLSPDGTSKQDGSKKTCYESIHENRSFVFVHVTAYSCKSVVRFTYFFFKSIFTWKSNQVYLQVLLQATKPFPHSQCLIYSVNLRIQSEYSKIRTRDNAVIGHFSHSGHYEKYAYLQAF